MDDDQLAARRAEIPVHCAGCGASFPGDTELNNGLCRECCRSPIHPIRKVERYRAALETASVQLGRGAVISAAATIDGALEGGDDA